MMAGEIRIRFHYVCPCGEHEHLEGYVSISKSEWALASDRRAYLLVKCADMTEKMLREIEAHESR